MVNIRNGLTILVVVSLVILIVLFFQDGSKKLEDRIYKDIDKIIINSETANINIYNIEGNNIRVVVHGTKKDSVKLIEGTKSLNIEYDSGSSMCLYKCEKRIDIYVPDNFPIFDIKTKLGNINSNYLSINNIIVNSDAGNISLYKVNNANIVTNLGNIFIKEINANSDSYIKSNIGNIKISKIINLKLDIKTETGSKVVPVIKNNQDYTLKIETNIGNIDIDSHEDKS